MRSGTLYELDDHTAKWAVVHVIHRVDEAFLSLIISREIPPWQPCSVNSSEMVSFSVCDANTCVQSLGHSYLHRWNPSSDLATLVLDWDHSGWEEGAQRPFWDFWCIWAEPQMSDYILLDSRTPSISVLLPKILTNSLFRICFMQAKAWQSIISVRWLPTRSLQTYCKKKLFKVYGSTPDKKTPSAAKFCARMCVFSL